MSLFSCLHINWDIILIARGLNYSQRKIRKKQMNELMHVLVDRVSKDRMVDYIKTHPEVLPRVLVLAASDKVPAGWRACWMLNHYLGNDDPRARPYISNLIAAIPGKIDGHQRELIKLISKMKLYDEQEGAMFDQCMNVWESVKKIPSTRLMAFRFIMSVLQKYPELINEVNYIAQDHYLDSLSPAIRKSVSRQLEILEVK